MRGLLRGIRSNLLLKGLLILLPFLQVRGKMMRAAQYENGGPENLYVGEVPVPELREKEVLIKVYATAINRADTLQRQGKYPPPAGESSILGLEAAGTVHKLGPNVTRWRVGDRVMALLPGGGYAEYVAVQETHAMEIPTGMNMLEAAAIPEAWLTAYQLLHFVGKVQADDVVLIHAGASGVGTAAVQLTKVAQAISIITAGSSAKIDIAKKLGAAEGFNYKTGRFADDVLLYTKGRGVDLVLDPVGANFVDQNAEVLAKDGRWIVFGLLSGANVSGDLLAKIIRKTLTITGSTLRARSREYKSKLIAEFCQNAIPHFENKFLQPIIDMVLPLEKVEEAHRTMEENKNTGKIILKVRDEHNRSEL